MDLGRECSKDDYTRDKKHSTNYNYNYIAQVETRITFKFDDTNSNTLE